MKEQKTVEINNEELNFNIDNNPTFYEGTGKLENNFFKKLNINNIIERKKKEIKYLVKKKLGNADFFINPRKPSPLKFLEKGFQKYLFSKNSDFLVHFPKIRKKYLFEKNRVSNDLNEKINIGSLVYLQLKDNQSNFLQEKYLKRSSIFKVENTADTIENELQKIISERKRNSQINFQKKIQKLNNINNSNNFSISNQNIGNSTINSSRYNKNSSRHNYNTSRNFNNKKIENEKNLTVNSKKSKRSRNISNLFKLTSYETPKNKKIKSYITLSGNNTEDNSENNKKIETNSDKMIKTTHSFFSPINPKIYNKTIDVNKKLKNCLNEKVNLLNKLTNKCNNQLYKLVDKSKNKERELSKLKDLEEVFSFKRRKKDPLEENTKNLVYQAKNDVYFGMDKYKAELLSLTDEVTRMPDDVALYLVDRIAKNYESKANLVEEVTSHIGFNPILQKIKNRQNKKIREKIEKNYKKIRSNLNEKVSLLNKLTNKCNNQLFKLVDSSKSKEREMSRLKDLEEVFSFKRKKKDPLEENTKNLVYQAKNDVYFGMDKNKAELLTLTDEVTRMPDDVALFFVDRIAKYYENKANLVEEVTSQIGFNPILQKIRNKQNKKLREKIERNFNKIVKLDASLDKKKEEVNFLHEQIFNKG